MITSWENHELRLLLHTLESGSRPKGGVGQILSGIPSIGGEHIKESGGFDFSEIRFVPKDYYNQMRHGKVKIDDILLVKDGATTGKVSFVDRTFPFNEAAVNEHVFVIRPLCEKILPEYLFFFIYSPFGQAQIKSNFHGAAQGGINTTFADNFMVPTPPIEVQKKIVAVLRKAHLLGQYREQSIKLTTKIPLSLFLKMFGDPMKNPKGWQTKKLEDLCLKILGGGTPSKSKPEYYVGEIPWVTPKDMKELYIEDSIDHISKKALEESSARLVPANSLLMVIRSGILKRELPVAVNLRDVAINQDMKGFILNKNLVDQNFMLYFFKLYQKHLLQKVRSVTADNLEFGEIRKIDVVLPPIELQNRFAEAISRLGKIRRYQNETKKGIGDLFARLMQKAFKGTLALADA